MVNEEVNSAVQKAMGKVLVEMIREVKKTTKPQLVEQVEEQVMEEEAPSTAAVIRTNNPKLSAALAATARNFKPIPQSGNSLAELIGGDFEMVGQGESAGISDQPQTKIDYLKGIITESAPVQSALDGGAAVPDMLQKVFKKDFRALMKAMDKKDKARLGG